jgi:hypothetical protein
MARKKLRANKDSDYIQIVIPKEDKIAFDRWCVSNSTTMSEIIRKEIAPYIQAGEKIPDSAV